MTQSTQYAAPDPKYLSDLAALLDDANASDSHEDLLRSSTTLVAALVSLARDPDEARERVLGYLKSDQVTVSFTGGVSIN